ncbi:MAG: hypothetical protein ACJA1A_001371 [Saprospiraceae bacterium]|jgi:hypothetical protein
MKILTLLVGIGLSLYLCYDTSLLLDISLLIDEDGLISKYDFDGNAVDSLGEHSGNVYGASGSFNRFGQLESALHFDGKNDSVNLGLDFLSYDSISISLWLFPKSKSTEDSIGTDQYFISSGEPGVSAGIYGVWNEGALYTGFTTTDRTVSSTYHSYLPKDNWYHIVQGIDLIEETSLTYVNGSLVNTDEFAIGSFFGPVSSLIVGAANFSDTNGFYGGIDDVSIYSKLLTIAEIESLYNMGCPDSINIPSLDLEQDSFLYAKSSVIIDSLQIDSTFELNIIAPNTTLDTGYISALSNLNIFSNSGCNQNQIFYKTHFEHRGVYINNFVSDGYLGNTLKEDSILDWAVRHGFNNVYLYNIGSAMSMGLQEELDSFVYKAHNWEIPIEVTFVSAGFGTSFTNIENFHDDYDNIPDGIVSEIEFWNGTKTYADDFAPWIVKMNSLKFDTVTVDSIIRNPNLYRRFYIGKVKDGGESPSLEIAENLVINHDEIFLTNYHSNGYNLSTSTSENSIRNKLSLLGEAGYNLSKKVNIVILFNVRQDSPAPQIWDFFAEEDEDQYFKQAYESFYKDFLEAEDIDYKNFLILKGYGIYRYSDAVEARE